MVPPKGEILCFSGQVTVPPPTGEGDCKGGRFSGGGGGVQVQWSSVQCCHTAGRATMNEGCPFNLHPMPSPSTPTNTHCGLTPNVGSHKALKLKTALAVCAKKKVAKWGENTQRGGHMLYK